MKPTGNENYKIPKQEAYRRPRAGESLVGAFKLPEQRQAYPHSRDLGAEPAAVAPEPVAAAAPTPTPARPARKKRTAPAALPLEGIEK